MKVKDLLLNMGGNANFCIQGTTEKDEYVEVARGKVDDIKFPLVPYGEYETHHWTVDENIFYIVIDEKYNFAEFNPEMTDINNPSFVGYIDTDNHVYTLADEMNVSCKNVKASAVEKLFEIKVESYGRKKDS